MRLFTEKEAGMHICPEMSVTTDITRCFGSSCMYWDWIEWKGESGATYKQNAHGEKCTKFRGRCGAIERTR